MRRLLFQCIYLITYSQAFVSVTPPELFRGNLLETSSSTSLDVTRSNIESLKAEIENEIAGTRRGLSASNAQRKKINTLVQQLEDACELLEPARSPLMGGKWIVDYTTSPPPSNGKLGPFTGFARQIIDLDKGTYINYLSVPGDIEKEWLSAKLEATFTEWDGIFLQDDRDASSEAVAATYGDSDERDIQVIEENNMLAQPNLLSSIQSIFSGKGQNKNESEKKLDYGASNWKVDFKTLTITAFSIPLITKTFDNTSRIWKMSYLDDETRVGK